MYDMHYDPDNDDNNEVMKYVKNNGSNKIVYIEYNYKQLGLDETWLKDQYDGINDPVTFRREVLLQRIHGSSDSPFSQEDIEYMFNCIQAVKEELYINDHFRFDVYEPLNRTIPYIVGVDCSTGTNNDNNAITILNPYTVRPAAEFKCPYIGETMYEQVLIELVRDHIPKAIVVIERNHVGDGVLDHLMSSPIASRLYFDKDRDLVETNIQDQSTVVSMLKKRGEMKKYYGVYTEGKSREDMIAILMRRVAEFKEDFVTKNITEDISKLVRAKSGKILAVAPDHDDSIMSYLIAMYAYYHGNNLHAFGFVKGSQEIENQNQGTKTFEDLRNLGIIPEHVIEKEKVREMVRKENDYEELMRQAILQSQRDSIIMQKKGLASSELLESTPTEILTEHDDEGYIDLSVFDDLNGF